jgi:hypothetical protein
LTHDADGNCRRLNEGFFNTIRGEGYFALETERRLWRGKPTVVLAVAASTNDVSSLAVSGSSPTIGR